MAVKMSEEDSFVENIEGVSDITECSICTDTFKEPKILLCSHTFCKNCLKSLATKLEKSSGDEIPCPICRKKFPIPEKGFDGLQKNVFMEKLIEMTSILRPSSGNICEACLDESSSEPSVSESELPKADVYCTDCRQKLCKECHRYHRKNKLSKTHKVLNLTELMELGKSKVAITMTKFCDEHDRKPLDIFCFDCDDVVCTNCKSEQHESHKTSNVDSVVDSFRKQLLGKVSGLDEFATELQLRSIKMQKYKKNFIHSKNQLEIEINKTREDLKALIDSKSDALLSKLKTSCEKSLQSMEQNEEEMKKLITKAECYKTDCEEMATIGSASNICKGFGRLQTDLKELEHHCESQMELENSVKFPFPEMMNKLNHVSINPLTIQLVGEFRDPISQIYMAEPRLSEKLESVAMKYYLSARVSLIGMTIIKNEFIIVVQVGENFEKIFIFEVYGLRTLLFRRRWLSERVTDLRDLNSYHNHTCLFALICYTQGKNASHEEIVRFNSNGEVMGSWSVNERDGKISVTNESILLASCRNRRLLEFTLKGQFLRDIELSPDLASLELYHAVKLNSGRYIIGCTGKLVVIGTDGKVLQEITKAGEAAVLKEPVYLEKDRDNNVIVADRGALIVFSSNLEVINAAFCRPVGLPISTHNPRPMKVSIKTEKQKIIIDELNKRVFVMKNNLQEIEVLHF